MKNFQTIMKIEYALLAIAVYGIYLFAGFAWYWPFVLFLAFDISMIGYLFNTKVGAVFYNIVHSFIAPSLVLIAFLVFQHETLLFIALLWFFHNAVDRACGYGLKYGDSFHHTHLGNLKSK